MATTDARQILKWWRRYPNSNIGVVTGARSRLVVVDIDGAAGEQLLQGLIRAHGPIPRTATVRTGRGFHLYFRAECPAALRRTSIARFGGGVDLIAERGAVVGPGSTHCSGRRYAWEQRLHPDLLGFAPVPEWIVAGLRP